MAFVRNKQIGFVFQSFNLLTKLTAVENVALPMIYAGMDKKTRNERAAALLASVGLGDRMDQFAIRVIWWSAATCSHSSCIGKQSSHHYGR